MPPTTNVRRSISVAICCAIAGLLHAPLAAADAPTRDQCVDAHSRGQDAREQSKLTLARKLFLVCAQSSCPVLVQGDCARFTDDLARQQPSLTLIARDAQGRDLIDTAVHIDGGLVASRLDDGKAHDVDPGNHTVRFTHDGKDQIVTIVVGTGEKGRAVVATFPTVNAPSSPPAGAAPIALAAQTRAPGPPEPRRSRGPLVLIGSGAVVALTGVGLVVLGVRRVPPGCTISPNHCAAAPGDPVFDQARSGLQLANTGIMTGAIGVAALTGGLVWYLRMPRTERGLPDRQVAPVLTRGGAGVALSGSF
jgi:hypothetical protein